MGDIKENTMIKKITVLILSVLMIASSTFAIKAITTDEKLSGYNRTQGLSPEEEEKACDFSYYNMLISGYHSANTADVEGPLFVNKDSNLSKDFDTFSYGVMFEEDNNGVGEPIDPDQNIALLIGGQVNNYYPNDDPTSLKYPTIGEGSSNRGWLVSSDTDSWKEQAFNMNLSKGKQRDINESQYQSILKSVSDSVDMLEEDLSGVTSMVKPFLDEDGKQMQTLGDYVDGRYVSYDIYQSTIDERILVVNVVPDKEGTVIFEALGFDYKQIIDSDKIDQVVVTSFDRESSGIKRHAEKVVFKGNYFTNHSGNNAVLDISRGPEHDIAVNNANKVLYYFPKAQQVTNFYNRVSWNETKAPTGITVDNPGLNEDKTLNYNKEYLKNYATGSSNNGSASEGGGAAIIGSVVAPEAAVVLASGNINGFLVSHDLHQRLGAEVHNFRNKWIHRTKDTGSIEVNKIDADDQSKVLEHAEFKLFTHIKSEKVYAVVNQDTHAFESWVTDKDQASVLKTNGMGKVSVHNLAPSRYWVEEVKAPDGYEILTQPIVADVTVSHTTSKPLKLDIDNHKLGVKPEHGGFKMIKYGDKSDQTPLGDAEYILYKKYKADDTQGSREITEYYTGFGEFTDWSSNILFAKHIITNTNGEAVVDGLLIPKDDDAEYYILEAKAPKGFDLNPEPVQIKLGQDPNTNPQVLFKAYDNEEEPWKPIVPGMPEGSILIDKFDASINEKPTSNNQLKGAEFILSKTVEESGSKVTKFYRGISDKDNPWTLEESQADHLISNNEGKVHVNHLRLGNYQIKEIKAPDGFITSSKIYDANLTQNNNENMVKIKVDIPNLPQPKVIVKKVDEDTATKTLAGAEFILYQENSVKEYLTENMKWSAQESEAKHFVTQSDGIAEINLPQYGVFYLKEVKAPDGYEINSNPLKLDIDEASKIKDYEFEISNKKIKPTGSIELKKVDKDNKSLVLEGAEFKLYRNDKNPEYYVSANRWSNNIDDGALFKTDHNGMIQVHNLELGSYYFKETKAPEGYDLISESLKVELTDAMNPPRTSVSFENKKKVEELGLIKLLKVDADDQSKVLSGADFYLIHDNQYYTESGSWSSSESDAKHLVTDIDGVLEVDGLREGTYTFREIKAPEGYEKAVIEKEVSLDFTSGTKVASVTFENSKQPSFLGEISLMKVDKNNANLTLEGAEFVLYRNGENGIEYRTTSGTWNLDKGKAKTYVTDGTGKISEQNLVKGTYAFLETKAPDGYDLNVTPVSIALDGSVSTATVIYENEKLINPLGSVSLLKVDAKKQSTALQGAEFIFYRFNDHQVKEYRVNSTQWSLVKDEAQVMRTGQDGMIKVEGLKDGTYYFEETRAPEGFELDTTPISAKLDSSINTTTNVVATNQSIPVLKGKVALKKTDSMDSAILLEGATFNFATDTSPRSYYAGSGKWTDNKNEALALSTDEAGLLEIENLDFGDYLFIETEAPIGYELDSEPHKVSVNDDQPVLIEITNKKIETVKGSIKLIKVDADDPSHLLEGASFIIFKNASDPEYLTTDNQWSKDRNRARGFKTDVEGVISVDDLELGTYFFEEIIAPEGYALDATPHKVLVEGGNDSQPVQIVIENTKLAKPKGSLELIKVDANNRSKYLNDAEFILYREGQGGIEYLTEMNTWSLSSDDAQIFVTAHQGIIKINNLEFGTYYFKEVKAPQGYELDETPIEMIVGVHNPDGTVRFKNQLKTIPEIPEEPNKPVIPELPTIPKEPELPATGVSKQNYTLEISVSLISAGAYLIIKGKRRRNLL